MKLKEYLEKNCLKYEFLTRDLNVSKHQISKWVHGKCVPRKETMIRICELTNGKVKFNDWFTDTIDPKP